MLAGSGGSPFSRNPYFPLPKTFFNTFLGSGPVVHSGGDGRTGGGGPGGLGVHGGIGIFIPRFLSRGACCLLLFAMATSLGESKEPYEPRGLTGSATLL